MTGFTPRPNPRLVFTHDANLHIATQIIIGIYSRESSLRHLRAMMSSTSLSSSRGESEVRWKQFDISIHVE